MDIGKEITQDRHRHENKHPRGQIRKINEVYPQNNDNVVNHSFNKCESFVGIAEKHFSDKALTNLTGKALGLNWLNE